MWKIVGGSEKGGLLVREAEDLRSKQLPGRLVTSSIVQELQRKGERLQFRLYSGKGPLEGWISCSVNGKALVMEESFEPPGSMEVLINCSSDSSNPSTTWFRCWVSPTETVGKVKQLLKEDVTWQMEDPVLLDNHYSAVKDCELLSSLQRPLHLGLSLSMLRRALRHDAQEADGNAALQRGPARGLVLWRWHRLEAALEELERKDDSAQLALQLALGRWPEAQLLAKKLQLTDAERVVDSWMASTNSVRFSPSPANFEERQVEVMPGLRQVDGLIAMEESVQLGMRLFLRCPHGKVETSRPLVLYFHGNAETVDTYKDPDVFHPLEVSKVSVLVADFRGYGYSTGSPSLATMATDGERIVKALPSFLREHQLPWPWPGGLYLFGRSMGGLVACHLAAVKGQLFKGVVLESTFCGSYAPGALPPEEPPQEASTLGSMEPRFWSSELQEAVEQSSMLCRKLMKPSMEELGLEEGLDGFVHMMASEDKLRGFAGRLLILHGEVDTIIPVSHAKRLCDAATFATRRLVTICKGHNDIFSSEKYVAALKKFFDGG